MDIHNRTGQPMDIHIRVIPHAEQRYDTVGDWYFDKTRDLQIRVSKQRDDRHEWLIAVHEMVEALQCMEDGVTQQEVDDFDFAWAGLGEPGDDPTAPYHQQHVNTTAIEVVLASMLLVGWKRYLREVASE